MDGEEPAPLADIAASLAPNVTPEEPPSGQVTRPVDRAWLGGVCQGLEDRLGWPTVVTRPVFLLLSVWMFLGVAVYAVLWLLFPLGKPEVAAGVAAASRRGYRTAAAPNRRVPVVVGAALVLYGVGVASLMRFVGRGWILVDAFGWVPDNAFALLGVCAGGALIWRQWDQRDRRPRAAAGWVAFGKAALGCLVAAASTVTVIWLRQGQTEALQVLAVGGVTLVGALLLAGPWLLHPEARAAERDEAVKEEAKADMAAHLHDSVLQTLAMLQRQADDPKAVAQLARHQERELRAWLYGEAADEQSFAAALKAEAAEVEDQYGVPVDVVTVGDAALAPELDAVVRAAREAILNAAKHSGAPRVDVYAEAGDDVVEVFVRDRGRGFDAASVAEDRMGIRGSILDRMHRYGGVVGLRSTVREGTEVRLEMKR
ncbi:MAG: PspC domain-containing protein [Propionibacteriaceae bacterium]|nr:PspC domain-containing protein [Propionibacteriaceae bacterium]